MTQKPELQIQLQSITALRLEDGDFAYHASDLYVVSKPGVLEFLKANYPYFSQVTAFVSPPGSGWNGAGKGCLDIPFAGNWPN